MLKQSPGWAMATLLAIFVAGGLVGGGIGMRPGHRWGEGGGRVLGPGRGGRGAAVHWSLTRHQPRNPRQQTALRALGTWGGGPVGGVR